MTAMAAPRFRPFLKMSARGVTSGGGGTWVATEKLHGANFVVAAVAGRADQLSPASGGERPGLTFANASTRVRA